MKSKKLSKKLELSKMTVAHLSNDEISRAKAGATNMWDSYIEPRACTDNTHYCIGSAMVAVFSADECK